MSMHAPCSHNNRHTGFTLIELLVVMAIIAVLIGLLLPTGQHGRELANLNLAIKDVRQIVSAETKSGKITTNLAELAKIGLLDPTLGSGSKDGYRFSVTAVPGGAFQVVGVPAAPGITGAADIVADPTGAVVSKPSRGADEARSAMFASLETEAAATLGRLLSQADPKQLPAVQRALQEGAFQDPNMIAGSFKRLDSTGDGKVTFSKILAYDPKGESPLGSFIASAARLMQLGVANEDVKSLPGVGLSDILPAKQECGDGQFTLKIVRGSSSLVTEGSQSGVAMAGLSYGSLNGAEFNALLPAVDPYLLAGRFVIGDEEKTALHGILIGQLKQEGRSSRQTLDGFFLVTGGSGALTGAFGSGEASIVWSDPKFTRFEAALNADLSFAP